MSDVENTVALLGFPLTGKSTYLGVLWQLIQDEEHPSVHELDFSGDRAYLQELGDRVAQLLRVDRTDVESSGGMFFKVGFMDRGDVSISVPDVAGETLRLLVEDRVWHNRFYSSLANTQAIVLFVHPRRIVNSSRTALTAAMLEAYKAEVSASLEHDASPVAAGNPGAFAPSDGGDPSPSTEHDASPAATGNPGAIAPSDGGNVSPSTSRPTAEYANRFACSAARIVDVMENIIRVRGRRSLRVSLVISAWDLVVDAGSPLEWATRELPAVINFLDSSERTDFRVFGVSAQGGDLPKGRAELSKKGSVRERAYARDGSGASVDFSEPLAWAVFGR